MNHEENYADIYDAAMDVRKRYEEALDAINKLHREKAITDMQRLDLLIAATRILEPLRTIRDIASRGRQAEEDARFTTFFGSQERV